APPSLQTWTGVSDAAVSSFDLPPTWLKIAGLEPPTHWPGDSLLPLLDQSRSAGAFRGDCFCEFEDEKAWPGLAFRAIRSQDWKLILRPERSAKNMREMKKLFKEEHEAHEYLHEPEMKA